MTEVSDLEDAAEALRAHPYVSDAEAMDAYDRGEPTVKLKVDTEHPKLAGGVPAHVVAAAEREGLHFHAGDGRVCHFSPVAARERCDPDDAEPAEEYDPFETPEGSEAFKL